MLLEGADVHARDNAGWNAVLCAANEHRVPNLEVLARHGADLGARTSEGKNGLHLALEMADSPVRALHVTEWFLEHGMTELLEQRDWEGRTPADLVADVRGTGEAVWEDEADRLRSLLTGVSTAPSR